MRSRKRPFYRTQISIHQKGFKVWRVDGKYIRRNIDPEFTNFGQHFRFHFIPQHEFFIDSGASPQEENFYIEHLLVEWRLMERGMTYVQALVYADRHERAERSKTRGFKRLKRVAERSRTNFVRRVHKELLHFYSRNGLKVWIVRGNLVRDFLYIDFTEGGHDKVYAFVPAHEVWLDDDLSPHDRRFVLVHELVERGLMVKGWSYHEAHNVASKKEYYCRHFPLATGFVLRTALKNNKTA